MDENKNFGTRSHHTINEMPHETQPKLQYLHSRRAHLQGRESGRQGNSWKGARNLRIIGESAADNLHANEAQELAELLYSCFNYLFTITKQRLHL